MDRSGDAPRTNIRWTRETFAELEPFRADGRWLNYFDDDEEPTALDGAFGQNLPRLKEVKRRYDPGNVFRHNQNIRSGVAPGPSAATCPKRSGSAPRATAGGSRSR